MLCVCCDVCARVPLLAQHRRKVCDWAERTISETKSRMPRRGLLMCRFAPLASLTRDVAQGERHELASTGVAAKKSWVLWQVTAPRADLAHTHTHTHTHTHREQA